MAIIIRSFNLKSHEPSTCMRTKEILIAGRYAGHTIDVSHHDGPTGPHLVTDAGHESDVNAILKTIANSSSLYPLYGRTAEKAAVDQWIDYSVRDVDAHATHLYPVDKLTSSPPEDVHAALDKLKASLETLNKHFLVNTFVASQRLSIADLALTFSLLPLFTEVFDQSFRKQNSNVIRWFETVINQPKFLAVVGPINFFSGKSPIPPVPTKKQAAKKKKKDDDADDGDDKDPELEEDGKKLDIMYLSGLPPSTFNLEGWKTKYANTTPTRPEATDWFWANFDPAGWSLFTFTDKYAEECTKDFLAANRIGGFLQRAEAVKNLAKFSMTSSVVLKTGNHYTIFGVWLFRGEVIPPEFLQVDDTNYYHWAKVDVNSEHDRNWVTDIWSWESPSNWSGKGEFTAARSWGC